MFSRLQGMVRRICLSLHTGDSERRRGQDRRQLTDRRVESRLGEQACCRRRRDRRYARKVLSVN